MQLKPNIEIERKFLVANNAWEQGSSGSEQISQGYLCLDVDRTVRVRRAGILGFMTVKGRSHGAVRREFEYQIPPSDANDMLSMCAGELIQKTRHVVMHDGMKWEVDVFEGSNAGLVVAEIELDSEDQAFDLPDWAGIEVTHDHRYFNSNLAVMPFKQWAPEGNFGINRLN